MKKMWHLTRPRRQVRKLSGMFIRCAREVLLWSYLTSAAWLQHFHRDLIVARCATGVCARPHLYAMLPVLSDKYVFQLVVDALHAARHSAYEGFWHRDCWQSRRGSPLELKGKQTRTSMYAFKKNKTTDTPWQCTVRDIQVYNVVKYCSCLGLCDDTCLCDWIVADPVSSDTEWAEAYVFQCTLLEGD